MKRFKWNKKGSAMLFVTSCIALLASLLTIFIDETRAQKSFYNHAAHSFGFFDQSGQLRGLVETEAESMRNLAFATIYDAQIYPDSDYKFLFASNGFLESGQTMQGQRDAVLKKFSFEPTLNKLGINLRDIQHNYKVEAEVQILPLDNKIPFSYKFKDEIEALLTSVLTANGVIGRSKKLLTEIKSIIDRTSKKNLKDRYIKCDFKGFERLYCPIESLTIGDFQSLESWEDTFSKNPSEEQKVIQILKDSLVFPEKVKAVNFFLANKYVQGAICNTFCKNHSKGESFAFDSAGELILDINSRLYQENKRLLEEMYKSFAPESRTKGKKLYEITDKDKVLLKKDTAADTFSSYSHAVQVSVETCDETYRGSLRFLLTDIYMPSD